MSNLANILEEKVNQPARESSVYFNLKVLRLSTAGFYFNLISHDMIQQGLE